MATRYNTTPSPTARAAIQRDYNTPLPKLKMKVCKKVLQLAKQFKFYPKGIKYWLQLYESNYMKALDCGACNCPFEGVLSKMDIIYLKKIQSFTLTNLTPNKTFISFIFIHPKFRRRGFAKSFIKGIQKHTPSIILSTLNPHMMVLCRKLNFECKGYMRDDPDDPNIELKFVWNRENDE
tara:strand:+ start:1261 stop:1797 length:537 start_codon:yes stop_codon:yes gene_type:complete